MNVSSRDELEWSYSAINILGGVAAVANVRRVKRPSLLAESLLQPATNRDAYLPCCPTRLWLAVGMHQFTIDKLVIGSSISGLKEVS